MLNLNKNYLQELVAFLHSVKWVFHALNTQYIIEDVIIDNKDFLAALGHLDLNEFPTLQSPQSHHPECLQKFIAQVNTFKISFETITTNSTKSAPMKKMSIKKQYEIENISKVINSVCKNAVTQLIDFGCGLGYLEQNLFDRFGYNVLGLESCNDRVKAATNRQLKYYPSSIGKVKFAQQFVTQDSPDFILNQLDDADGDLAIIGLHGCGDLTVTAIKLFLNMKRVKKLIFMPCCYHKMSPKDKDKNEFNYFPLSQELKSILQHYSAFLNRPFLRLAGQESPAKWKELDESLHWIHGKNMFERALVEALITDDETAKRINNITFPENRVTMADIALKYQLLEKSSGKSKQWSEIHREKFQRLREKYPNGEENSENLFCLQTTLQSNCENLVLIDRVRYIQEEGRRNNQRLNISVKKLQNDKLSPRCLILIAEKL